MIKNITNLGDAALYCDFGDEVNITTNSKVINYFKNIKINKIDGHEKEGWDDQRKEH